MLHKMSDAFNVQKSCLSVADEQQQQRSRLLCEQQKERSMFLPPLLPFSLPLGCLDRLPCWSHGQKWPLQWYGNTPGLVNLLSWISLGLTQPVSWPGMYLLPTFPSACEQKLCGLARLAFFKASP